MNHNPISVILPPPTGRIHLSHRVLCTSRYAEHKRTCAGFATTEFAPWQPVVGYDVAGGPRCETHAQAEVVRRATIYLGLLAPVDTSTSAPSPATIAQWNMACADETCGHTLGIHWQTFKPEDQGCAGENWHGEPGVVWEPGKQCSCKGFAVTWTHMLDRKEYLIRPMLTTPQTLPPLPTELTEDPEVIQWRKDEARRVASD